MDEHDARFDVLTRKPKVLKSEKLVFGTKVRIELVDPDGLRDSRGPRASDCSAALRAKFGRCVSGHQGVERVTSRIACLGIHHDIIAVSPCLFEAVRTSESGQTT